MSKKEEIINLLKKVKRDGINDLIHMLQSTDFFTAPCSTKYHLAREEGLAEHSLNVYKLLKEKIERYKIDIPEESIIICGLLHDVCKINFYKKTESGVNSEWVIEDTLPLGHGEKSVMMIQDFIRLTNREKLAIRWHMVAFDAGIHFNYPSGYAFRKASQDPLVVLLFTADYEASQILEKEGVGNV